MHKYLCDEHMLNELFIVGAMLRKGRVRVLFTSFWTVTRGISWTMIEVQLLKKKRRVKNETEKGKKILFFVTAKCRRLPWVNNGFSKADSDFSRYCVLLEFIPISRLGKGTEFWWHMYIGGEVDLTVQLLSTYSWNRDSSITRIDTRAALKKPYNKKSSFSTWWFYKGSTNPELTF